jgi:hypothetical protein
VGLPASGVGSRIVPTADELVTCGTLRDAPTTPEVIMSHFRAVASLLAAVLLLAAAGCGDDASASDRVCDARSELRDNVQAVGDDVAEGNLGDARDGLDESSRRPTTSPAR